MAIFINNRTTYERYHPSLSLSFGWSWKSCEKGKIRENCHYPPRAPDLSRLHRLDCIRARSALGSFPFLKYFIKISLLIVPISEIFHQIFLLIDPIPEIIYQNIFLSFLFLIYFIKYSCWLFPFMKYFINCCYWLFPFLNKIIKIFVLIVPMSEIFY